jgi:hypothetical protein
MLRSVIQRLEKMIVAEFESLKVGVGQPWKLLGFIPLAFGAGKSS